MPSCIKSFILPIAFQAHLDPTECSALLNNLKVDRVAFLNKWIEYTPKFPSEAAHICYLGLLSVLLATASDLELAAV